METAELIAARLPGVPVKVSEALDDYPPPLPEDAELPDAYAEFRRAQPAAELARGRELAEAAINAFAGPAEAEAHELVVTHAFLIGWFVRHALHAPDWRWMGLNAANCSLTAIRYRDGYPPSLLCFNDLSHLPEPLRWTGFPAGLRL